MTALRGLLLPMVMAPVPDVIHQTKRRVASMPHFSSIAEAVAHAKDDRIDDEAHSTWLR